MGLLDILNSVYSRCFDILQGKLRGKDRPGGKILGAPRQQPLFPVVLLSLDGIDEPEETPTIGECGHLGFSFQDFHVNSYSTQ